MVLFRYKSKGDVEMVKNNKGLIIFFIAVVIFAILWCNQVEKDNERMNAIKLQERS